MNLWWDVLFPEPDPHPRLTRALWWVFAWVTLVGCMILGQIRDMPPSVPTPTIAEVIVRAIRVATIIVGIADSVAWVRSIPHSSD